MEISDDATADKEIKAFFFTMEGGKAQRLVYPLQLDPLMRLDYFEKRQPFDFTKLLYNPMVWMLALPLLMSQMMKGMDKKELEEAQKQQQQMMGDNMPQCAQQ